MSQFANILHEISEAVRTVLHRYSNKKQTLVPDVGNVTTHNSCLK